MRWNRILGVFVFALVCLTTSYMMAQATGAGAVSGSVRDQSGAVVPGANVSLTGTQTGVTLTTKSTSAGDYIFPIVPVGEYSLTFSATGFSQLVHQNIVVPLGKTVSVNASLQVGAASTTVQVQALASQIETNTAQASTTIDQQTFDNLPIALTGQARSATGIASLMPGVADTPQTTYGQVGAQAQMFGETINGGQAWGGSVVYDGIPASNIAQGAATYNNQPIPVEALQEFSLVQNNFDPEYGRTPGGVLTYSTRAGTNAFHGQAYDYLQNNDLDAAGYYGGPTGTPKKQQNEFGVNVGGPILIPHVFNGRDKAHFFAFYSGFRLAAGVPNNPMVLPTLAQRTGDFTAYNQGIFDPTTQACVGPNCTRQQYDYQGTPNLIPPSEISTAGSTYVSYLPQPNLNVNAAPGVVNFVPGGINNAVQNRWGGRVDLNITSRDEFHGFFATGPDNTENFNIYFLPGLSSYGASIGANYSSIVNLGYDHTFSPNLLLHLGAGWNRFSTPSVAPYNTNLVTFGIGGQLSADVTPQMYFAPSGGSGPITYPSSGGGGSSVGVSYAYIENGFVSWTKGRHSFRFGAELQKLGNNSSQTDSMVDQLSYQETNDPQNPGTTGDAFASLLAGYFSGYQGFQYLAKYDIRFTDFSTYFNDTWKFSPKLTLNLGIRYEIPGTQSVTSNVFSNFDPGLANPGAGGLLGALVFAGNGPSTTYCNCTHMVNPDYKIFQPRIGLAYMLDNDTVVHAGYGIFASAGGATYGTNGEHADGFNAAAQFFSPNNGITPAFTVGSGTPAFTPPPFISPTFDNGGNIRWIAKNAKLPGIIQSYTLDIQHQLPHGWLVDIGYVGNTAQHLSGYLLNPEQLPIGYQQQYGSGVLSELLATSGTGIPAPFPEFYTLLGPNATVNQALRAYPQYTNIIVDNQNTAMSNYNSLQAKIQKQYRNGFSFLGSYTWGRIFTNAEDFIGPFNNGPQDQYNPAHEYAPAYTEPPQTLVFSYNYDLPFGYQKKWLNHGLMATLAGGWGVSGVQHYQTGTTMFELVANDNLAIFNNHVNLNVVPGQSEKATWQGKYNPYTDYYINPNAFAQPPANEFGDGARQIGLRGFGLYNEDLSVRKNFHIWESADFQFRADFFNAFNRVLLGGIQGNYGGDPQTTPQWGFQQNQQTQPRSIQFSAKMLF